jgi:hypothetical protein
MCHADAAGLFCWSLAQSRLAGAGKFPRLFRLILGPTLNSMDTMLPSTNSCKNQRTKVARKESEKEPNKGEQFASAQDLLLLFRLLMKEPPQGHDFKTCPTCKRYGIDRI